MNENPEIIVIGKPLTSNSKDFNEDELHDKRFMSFMLIPLEYTEGGLNFGYILDKIDVSLKVPKIKVFPKEPPVITYAFSNSLDDTFLSSIISGMVNFAGGLRYLMPQISFSQSDYAKMIQSGLGHVPFVGEHLSSGFETLAKVFDGYTAMLPKVWTHSEAGTSLRLEVEEQLWIYGKDAPKRFNKIMNALKNFISPRVSKPVRNGTGSVATETEELNLGSFLYSHPYFCRVTDGKKMEKVFIPAGMVTNANINIDTKDLRYFFDKEGAYKGATPNVLKIELEITPLHFSMVADTDNVFGNVKEGKNIMTFERLINSWMP